MPKQFATSVYDIDFKRLQRRGIKAAIFDLDNTLVEMSCPDATPRLVNWLNQLQKMGFRVMIVSNNSRTRVSRFALPLGVPYIHRAMKPLSKAFIEAMRRMESRPEETAVIGDQLFTDVLGGNRLGLYTILVAPISHVEGFWTKINRRMERLAFNFLRKRGLLEGENHHDGRSPV